jgi:hypothetical protein
MASAEEAAGARTGIGLPLIIAATFAAGAGAALAAKSVLAARRKGSVPTPAPGAGAASDEDLTGTLRRAALDVAIAATNEAAERLSDDEQGREAAVEN